MGFRFDRAGVRVPTMAISAYTEPGTIISAPFEHTALIKTLATQWDLGHLTERDRTAPDLSAVFNRTTPRPRESWPVMTPQPYEHAEGTNVGARLNALQAGITALGAAVFDEAGRVEDEVQTVGAALTYLRDVRRRLRV